MRQFALHRADRHARVAARRRRVGTAVRAGASPCSDPADREPRPAAVLAVAEQLTLPDSTEAVRRHVAERLRRRAEDAPGHLSTVAEAQPRPGSHALSVSVALWRRPEELRAHLADEGLAGDLRGAHSGPVRRDRVLWWIADGHTPTVAEAAARLEHLHCNGPGPEGFTLRSPVPQPSPSAARAAARSSG